MPSADDSVPVLSVIVPSRDRPSALGSCLDALERQTVVDEIEVLVVDDGSKQSDEVAAVVRLHPHARLLGQVASGPAAARNTGIREARGAILCFTDDDCVPRPDWAQSLAEAIRNGADVVAGQTLSAGGALADASELIAEAPTRAPAPAGSDLPFARTNNLACKRAVADGVPFDESYPRAAGEDREWCARVTTAGYSLRREREALVLHDSQLTLAGFLRQQVRYGEGAHRFRRGRPESFGPPAFYASLLRRAFAAGPTVGLLVAVAQVATALGFAKSAIAKWSA